MQAADLNAIMSGRLLEPFGSWKANCTSLGVECLCIYVYEMIGPVTILYSFLSEPPNLGSLLIVTMPVPDMDREPRNNNHPRPLDLP